MTGPLMTPVLISISVLCMDTVRFLCNLKRLALPFVYCSDQTTQDTVRDKASGRGYLYPDCFAEERLIFLPPAASALLVIFNRNHNFICDMLLKINERKKWTDPIPADPKKLAAQDEEIFQTARLVK
jgi:linoleate 10R-lipoxygenase